MKKPVSRTYFLFLVPLLFIACSEEDPSHGGKIVATIDGTNFEADGEALLYANETSLSGKSGSETIWISITKPAAVGTYEIKGAAIGPPADAWITYTPDGSKMFSSEFGDPGLVVGTLTITEIDETNKTISGTFSCKLFHGADIMIEVASGAFNKIPYEAIPPNLLSAKIDGMDFTAPIVVCSNSGGDIFVLGKTPSESQVFQLLFNSDIAVGTQPWGEYGDDIYAMYTVDQTSFVSNGGTLTITKHDTSSKVVEGTFNFEGKSVIGEEIHTITAGSFSVKYY